MNLEYLEASKIRLAIQADRYTNTKRYNRLVKMIHEGKEPELSDYVKKVSKDVIKMGFAGQKNEIYEMLYQQEVMIKDFVRIVNERLEKLEERMGKNGTIKSKN